MTYKFPDRPEDLPIKPLNKYMKRKKVMPANRSFYKRRIKKKAQGKDTTEDEKRELESTLMSQISEKNLHVKKTLE